MENEGRHVAFRDAFEKVIGSQEISRGLRIYNLSQIRSTLDHAELLKVIEGGFVLYSDNKVVVPPVGHLGFLEPPGDVHIKYGYIQDDDRYVIKIASSFYENPKNNLPSSNGLMLVFNRKTGGLEAILADEGYLTNVRTAAAGAVIAKYMAPRDVRCIGIVGAGVQARMQLEFLKEAITCRNVIVWGRGANRLDAYKVDMMQSGFHITTTTDLSDITKYCNLIVTTTASRSPLIYAGDLKKGTHITAVGADTKEKQEIDAGVFAVADLVVADSIEQCVDHGDTAHAIREGTITREKLIELGNVIIDPQRRRTNDDQITVVDLTGIAVQDIQIAKYVYAKLVTASKPSVVTT